MLAGLTSIQVIRKDHKEPKQGSCDPKP
jgi:hypothetical protein